MAQRLGDYTMLTNDELDEMADNLSEAIDDAAEWANGAEWERLNNLLDAVIDEQFTREIRN